MTRMSRPGSRPLARPRVNACVRIRVNPALTAVMSMGPITRLAALTSIPICYLTYHSAPEPKSSTLMVDAGAFLWQSSSALVPWQGMRAEPPDRQVLGSRAMTPDRTPRCHPCCSSRRDR